MSKFMAPALKTDSDSEHPVVAWAGILAVLAAAVLILWARVEVHGTDDLESALSEEQTRGASPQADKSDGKSQVDDAVATGRWAAGFSP
jgi:hypothetical protein